MIDHHLASLLCLGLLSGPVCLASTSADEDLERYFRAYLDADCRAHPTMATQLGDHRFDDQLDDVTAKARARWLEQVRATLAELPTRIAYPQLSRNAQIDYEIFRDHLERTLALTQMEHPFEEDPRVYVDLITDSVYRLFMQSTVPRATTIRNAIARINAAPAVLDIARQTLTHPPRVVVETASQQNRGAIAFLTTDLLALEGDTDQREELMAASARLVMALRQHQQFLDLELMPRATGSWRIGPERFARKLGLVLQVDCDADRLVADARAAIARIQGGMAVIARQLWSSVCPERALPSDDPAGTRALITTVLEHIGRDHGTATSLSSDAQATLAGIKAFIVAHRIVQLPEPDHLQVVTMPEFQRGNTVADLSAAPPLDAEATSIYAISPPPQGWDAERVEGFLAEYNRRMLQMLSIHEAYPGHHLQLTRANRLPSLVRKVLGSGVYMEGWAVYCEQMMLDQGYGEGDCALRLVHLKYDLRSAANAILDHDLHCTAMDDAQALHLLMDEAYQTRGEALLKIRRAQQGSCQLSTYFVGQHAFADLRRAVQCRQGERFDLLRFHEALIAHGAVPIRYLPELVQQDLGDG